MSETIGTFQWLKPIPDDLQVPKGMRLYYCFSSGTDELEGWNLVEKGLGYSVWYKFEQSA